MLTPGGIPYYLLVILTILLICSTSTAQQMNFSPFINLLRPENVNRMAELATEISSIAARSVVQNEMDTKKVAEPMREVPISNGKPSEILGQSFSNLASQSRNAFLNALSPLEVTTTTQPTITTTAALKLGGLGIPRRPDGAVPPQTVETEEVVRRKEPSATTDATTLAFTRANPFQDEKTSTEPTVSKLDQNPLMRLAQSFLRGARGESSQASPNSGGGQQIPQLGIRDLLPGANNNFGIPTGKGCLPFVSEFMQAAYGDCQKVADEKAFDAWGNELKNAILTGTIDLLSASQETCRRTAERQQCAALRRAISDCAIVESLSIGTQLQRAMKRCEDVGGLLDQNPLVIIGQLNKLIGGEFAQGFLNNFLTAKQQ